MFNHLKCRSVKFRRVLLAGCASAALVSGAVWEAVAEETAGSQAGEVAADVDGIQKRTFDVAPQDLNSALDQWSLVSGADWGYIGVGFANSKTVGVQGEYTAYQALERILAGTGYTYRVVSSGDVSIIKIQADVPVAQAPQSETPPAADEKIDKIIVRYVTAQRKEEDIQDVPVAVSAFNADQLSRRQITTTNDLLRHVTNLVGANNVGLGTSVTYFLRGVGSTESIATFDLPVGTYVDEVYISRQNANQIRLSGMERVEVLRGPQGTLFGRNTTGGAVSIITKKPEDEFDAGLEVGYGSYERFTGSGYMNLPLADGLSARMSGFVVNEEGFMENTFNDETFNGEKSWGIRGALRWQPSDRVTWDASAQYIETDYLQIGTPEILDPVTFAGTQKPVTGDLRVVRLTDRQCKPTGAPATWPLQGCHFNSADAFLTISNLAFSFDAGTLNLITGFYDLQQSFNIDFIGNTNQPVFFGLLGPNFYISNMGKHQQVSQEVKWTGNLLDGRLSYVSGFFYMQEDNETQFADTIFLAPGAPLTLANRTPMMNETRSIAFYTQADFNITEDLTLQAGVRWTEEDKDLSVDGIVFDFGTFSFVPLDDAALEAEGIPLHQNASRWTPRVALSYDFTDDIMAYASFTEGFKSGGWNARGTSALELQPFGPEFVDSYEVGLRSEWFDGRMLVNLTLFHAIYDEFQVPSVFPQVSTFVTLNSGKAEVDGLELEAAASLTETLDVFANLGLMDGTYEKLSAGAIAAGIGPELQRTPNVTAQIGFVQDIHLPGDHLVQLAADLKYVGEFEHLPANLPEGTIDETLQLNAQLSWTAPDKHWMFIAECKNCTDQNWFTQNFFNILYPADPRRWGVRASYRY